MSYFKKQNHIIAVMIILLAITLYANQTNAFSTWADPTANPPGNNADTPINVGGTAQVKTGNLGLGNVTSFPAKLNIIGSTGGKPISMFHPSQNGQFEWQFDNSGAGSINRLRFNKTGTFGSAGSIADIISFDFFGNVGIASIPDPTTKLSIGGLTQITSGGLLVSGGNTYLHNNLGIGVVATKKLDVMVNSDSDGVRLRRSDNSTGISFNSGNLSPWIDYVGKTGYSDLWFIPKGAYADLGNWVSSTTAPASFRISGLGTNSYIGARKFCDIDGLNCFQASDVGGSGNSFWSLSGIGIYNTNPNRNVGIGTNAPLRTVGGKSQTVLEVNAAEAGTSGNPDGHAAVVIRANAGSNPRLFFGTGASSSDTSNKPTWVIYQRNGSSAAGQLTIGNHANNVTAMEFSNSATPVTTINYGLKFTGGAPALNKILTSDATGLASWKAVSEIPGLGGDSNWEVSSTNANLLYNKNQASASAVVVGGNTQSIAGSKFEVNGLAVFKGILGLTGTNAVEFGKNVVGKQVDAGKIMYKRYSNGLDIIGAGDTGSRRIVKIWDDLIVDGSIWATNICSNTDGSCNSVTNILDSVGLWTKTGSDVKLAGATDNAVFGADVAGKNLVTISPNGKIKIKKGATADVSMATPVSLDLETRGYVRFADVFTGSINNNTNSNTGSITFKQGDNNKLSIAGSVQVANDTNFIVGGTTGKFRYQGNGADVGKILVATNSNGDASWQDLPIIYANFTKNAPAWVCGSFFGLNCQNFYNSDFTKTTGSSDLISATVTEPDGIGTRDVINMLCPSGYKAIAGGVTCAAGGYNIQTNSQTGDGRGWNASCGTALNNMLNANITCAKIQ